MLGHTLIDRYQLTRILGSGGFGQTYLAVDISAADVLAANVSTTDEPADTQGAQNVVNPCVVKQLQLASQDKSFLKVARRLFQTEADTLEKLGSHPHIPTLLNSFEEGREFYLVQEFIDGCSLEEEIQKKGKFDEAQAITLLEKVLPVLKFVHENRVIHRDLKPDNLIRRKDSDEIALIDFGAVKQIRTRLYTGEKSALTIGIGTQGYTPSEQLSGKPRYSSDIYALGMTIIHALTGRSPHDLPESPETLEPQWQQYAQVSPGLAILIAKMTRHYIYQRYQTVEEVQHDLGRLEELPGEFATAQTSLEPGSVARENWNSEAETVIVRWKMDRRAKRLTVMLSTLITSACILGLRQIGTFVPAELSVWDRWVNAQTDKGPDERMLVVEITEEDLRALQTRYPSDQLVAEVIDNLQQHNPISIGLNLDKDVPHEPGTKALAEQLNSPNVVTITRINSSDRSDIGQDSTQNDSRDEVKSLLLSTELAAESTAESTVEQISFNNIEIDSDLRVRRAILRTPAPGSSAPGSSAPGSSAPGSLNGERTADERTAAPIFSLGTELALRYLESANSITPSADEVLTLADVRFKNMTENFGGYQNIPIRKYQIPLQYRSSQTAAPTVSFLDVLNNRFDSDLVKDRIVFIGMAAASGRDLFLTPYKIDSGIKQMPGTVIHAQVASQILSAVIDRDRLLWDWPEWAEVAWIISLTATGSVLMVLTRKGPVLIAFGVGGLLSVYLVSLACFHAGGWVPVAAPMNAFFFSAAGARISKSYQRRHWEARQ
ncbi:MAG: CHASE2 domain-containing protein [Cyanobacteria bacterium P01_D01_bin.1]